MKRLLLITAMLLSARDAGGQTAERTGVYREPHRPQFHFSPRANWMNDPNGLVFYDGVYHLFFQQDPTKTTTGNLHWGHATSRDLVRWREHPTALAPDELGLIFSGSAVLDSQNTSGFGTRDAPALVALYTSHSVEREQQGRIDYENQSLAYSSDKGETWTKYRGNPVLKNPGITDFRDPKVTWHEPSGKWVMALAAKDRVHFYSSPDLKSWKKESEFGAAAGAHGGVWECPDLISFDEGGRRRYVLLVSINPGGPNGGSATQYFVGDFDGKTFTPAEKETKWIDWGTDDYAGVTWSNTGARRIFIGWMSNWQYGQQVPTETWRGAMTVPRELDLATIEGRTYLASRPVPEIDGLMRGKLTLENFDVRGAYDLAARAKNPTGRFRLRLALRRASDWSIVLSNKGGERVVVGYDRGADGYYVDRTRSGKINFEPGFARVARAPRIARGEEMSVDLLVDSASLELFADAGLTTMTSIFFPNEPLRDVKIAAESGVRVRRLEYAEMASIWTE